MQKEEILNMWHKKATENQKTICLPEATKDARTLRATRIFKDKNLGIPLLLEQNDELKKLSEKEKVSLEGFKIIEIDSYENLDELITLYQKKRAKENLTEEEAKEIVTDPVFFGALLLETNVADGMVAGAITSTANVLRAAFKCVGPAEKINTVSSAFIMILKEHSIVKDGLLIFSDCAVIPEPNPDQLVDIGLASSHTCEKLLHTEPQVAYLSFSSKGSAEHPTIERVREAVKQMREKHPEIKVDGELQLDSALSSHVAAMKCPDCVVCGHANILVFPNLAAGNIGYKLVERLAGAKAIGPIIQGLKKPINDLSRGCDSNDIVEVAVITALQSIN